MRVQRRGRLRAACLTALACAACLGGAARAAGDLFDELYQRGQTRNADLRTLTATFTETSTSSLLTRPLVARGTVAVARPARVALRYSEPDERQLIIQTHSAVKSSNRG